MNTFHATVEAINSDEFFSCITVRAADMLLKLLKTQTPSWLSVGDEVECRVQEAAIAICRGTKEESVSIENRLQGQLHRFRKGTVLSEVSVQTPCGALNSLITTDAFERMELCEGCEVTLLLKAVDIKLTPPVESLSYEKCKEKLYPV
ncbi:MAG: TOBE domain-containing protein [Campylobacterota bacterium]